MNRSALARATENTDSPTPGYLYIDIAKSVGSAPSACKDTAQYLIKRLQKNQHNVKFKSLKVLAKTAENPATRGQFKREICQNQASVALIKEALQYRGPPDPIRGDEIYAKVRTAAKECLDAIYSDTGSEGAALSTSNAALGGMGANYGGPAYNSGGYGGASSGAGGRAMEGIGNPMFTDHRIAQDSGKSMGNMTIGQVASTMGETIVGMIKDPLARNVNRADESAAQAAKVGSYNSNSYGGPPGRNELAQATGGKWTMASNRGPTSVMAPQNYNSNTDGAYFKAKDSSSNAFSWAQSNTTTTASAPAPIHSGVRGSWAMPGSVPPANQPSVAAQARQVQHQPYLPSQVTGGEAVQDGSYEKSLIQELCPPGGMKPEPPQEKLDAFTRAINSLNSDLVCPALLDSVEDGQPWIIKAKALCVMEATLIAAEKYFVDGPNPYSDFFVTCLAEIEPLASHARPAVRDPAKRVLKVLGIERTGNPTGQANQAGAAPLFAPPPAPVPAPVPPSPMGNLLDFGEDDVAVPSEQPPLPPSAPPPPPPSEPIATPGGLFGGLNLQSPGPPPSVPSPATPVQPPISTPDLFADMTTNIDVSSTEITPENGFTNTEPAESVSSFGFINGDTPAETIPEVQEPTMEATDELLQLGTMPLEPIPSSTNQTFDPLLSLGTSPPQAPTQQQMMMMPPQMQAMAYQQNMIMMQQQMQQMQLAMQQQQQQPSPNAQATPGVNPQLMPVTARPTVMQGNSMRQIPLVGNASGGGMNSFSFLENPDVEKKQAQMKSFDFIKDAMKGAK